MKKKVRVNVIDSEIQEYVCDKEERDSKIRKTKKK